LRRINTYLPRGKKERRDTRDKRRVTKSVQSKKKKGMVSSIWSEESVVKTWGAESH